MKDWQKIFLLVIGIIIMVLLVIGGINAIIFVIKTKDELGFFSGYFLFEKNYELAVIVGFYSGSRPNRNMFITGIVLIGIGVVGFFIITGKSHSHLNSKLSERQKSILKPILIIISLVMLIGGVSLFFIMQNAKQRLNIYGLIIILFDVDFGLIILFLLNSLNPYSSPQIIGIVTSIIGVATLFFQLSFYKSSGKIVRRSSRYRRYEPIGISPYRAISQELYKRRPKRKITIKKCPACHAPLRKKPPCECEYCGTVLDY